MRRTEPFRIQHAELLFLAEQIERALDVSTLLEHGGDARQMLLTLAGALHQHSAQEDDRLYPMLLRHRDESVRSMARAIREEFGVIYASVEVYLGVWSRIGAIEEDPAHFVGETRNVLATLRRRIAREDDELYSLIDGLADVRSADPTLVRSQVTPFAEEARRFTTFVEGAASSTEERRIQDLAARLAALYAAALALPLVEAPESAQRTPRLVTGEDATRLGTWVGTSEQYYWQVFDPFVEEAPVIADLEDDVLAIAQALHLGITEWDAGRPLNAAWHWRDSFETRWGDRVVDALRAVHRLLLRVRR